MLSTKPEGGGAKGLSGRPKSAKYTKTVIAYKMKIVHDKDFLKALLICKSALVLDKNCCTPSIDLKPFPMNCW